MQAKVVSAKAMFERAIIQYKTCLFKRVGLAETPVMVPDTPFCVYSAG